MALSMAGAPSNDHMVAAERELVSAYGFVPELFRAQGAEPSLISAEARLLAALLAESRLRRRQKEVLLFAVASARGNEYWQLLHAQGIPPDDEESRPLLDFASKLACCGLCFSARDIEALRQAGFDDQAILEAVATTALGQMLCVLAKALQPSGHPERLRSEALNTEMAARSDMWEQPAAPYLKSQPQPAPDFKPFAVLRDQLGFIPKVFRAQMLLPDLVAAEVGFLDQIVQSEESLSRVQKETVLLAVSAANLNTYGVALQRQLLDGLGLAFEQSDAIVNNLRSTSIPPPEKALLEEVSKLNSTRPHAEACFQTNALENHGFTKPQIVEAIAVAAFANFLNTLQFGLGVTPDFPPARIYTPKDLYLSTSEARPTSDRIYAPDPDAELVKQVQDGKVDVFEELVRRHSGRVFGTVAAIVGNLEDARDATQDVFLKAFENIARFEGRAKFSTWLISIAINTGTEMLRHRKHTEPLGAVDDDEDFRPRHVQTWTDDPEQVFTATQRNELVRDGILRLPEKYRVALILRDVSQLSSEEAAAALEIGVPALKARVLRGRLMLRERLAPHFARDKERDDA
jgi:RNA polymerase sigma-70 factor (ECF subfamily)